MLAPAHHFGGQCLLFGIYLKLLVNLFFSGVPRQGIQFPLHICLFFSWPSAWNLSVYKLLANCLDDVTANIEDGQIYSL